MEGLHCERTQGEVTKTGTYNVSRWTEAVIRLVFKELTSSVWENTDAKNIKLLKALYDRVHISIYYMYNNHLLTSFYLIKRRWKCNFQFYLLKQLWSWHSFPITQIRYIPYIHTPPPPHPSQWRHYLQSYPCPCFNNHRKSEFARIRTYKIKLT